MVSSCPSLPNVSGLVVLLLLVVTTTRYAMVVFEDILALQDTQCHQECIEIHISEPPTWKDPDLIEAIRTKHLEPPPEDSDMTPVYVASFVWKDLVDWNQVQGNLVDLWKGQAPGTYVEIGAVDGEFMSQTLLLERNLSWTGLLIEPDPRSYRLLQKKKRNAVLSDLCLLPEKPSANILWMHHLADDLPQQYLSIMMARSKLAYQVVVQEVSHGRKVYVPCVPLSTILLASNLTRVDLLTVATGMLDDREMIQDVFMFDLRFQVKTLLIQYPRNFLMNNPYPDVPGYIHDMGRSTLLVRLYWKKTLCRLVDDKTCKRQQYYDLVEACFRYLCDGHATVWTYE